MERGQEPQQLEFDFDAKETYLEFDKKGMLQLEDVVMEMKRLHPEWDEAEIDMRKQAQKSYWETQWRRKHYPEDYDPMMR